MNPQTLLNKPQTSPAIVARISKIGNLAETSDKVRKSSTSLRKVFEKGTYQKKTQLSILKRYKKRLDSIQKQNDKNFFRKKQVKIKLPDIKKYAGNLFTPGSTNDPLKAIGALAAFNTAQKVANKDYLGAIGPALVAAGIFLGPSILRGGVGLMRRGGGQPGGVSGPRALVPPTGNRTVFGGITSRLGRVGSPTGTPGIRSNIGLTARQFEAGAFMRTPGARAAFPVALPGTPSTAERLGATSQNIANRFATRGGAVAAEAATARTGGSIAAKAAGVGSRAIPLLGTALNIGLSAYRFSQGDVVGGILSALSAIPIVGWAALGVDLAREFGAFDGTFLGRKGALQKQTKEQKKLVEQKKKEEQGGLTFGKTLNRYEKVVDKFVEFSKAFKISSDVQMTEGGNATPPAPPLNPYTGPISKDAFWPLPGGVLTPGGGLYGAQRNYGGHSGQDIGGLAPGSPVVAWKTGTVTVEPGLEDGDNIISIDHGGGVQTKYKHVVATVNSGDTVYGGQQIATLFPGRDAVSGRKYDTHLHFEVWKNGSHINPNADLGASQRIPSPMTPQRAKEIFNSNSTPQQQERQLIPSPKQQPISGVTIPNIRQLMGQFTFGMPPKPAPSSPITPLPSIERLSLQTPTPQPITIPVPIQQPRQKVVPVGGGGGEVIMSGPSQQQLLNSFYRRVLLNTV